MKRNRGRRVKKHILTSFNTTNYRINTDTKWIEIRLNVLVKRNQLTEKQLYTKATLDFPEDQTRFPIPLPFPCNPPIQLITILQNDRFRYPSPLSPKIIKKLTNLYKI